MTVNRDACARCAAEQLVKRKAGNFRFDVPQRHVDGGDRAHRHRSAPPIGAAMEILPNILDLMRIAADQTGDDVIGEVTGNGELTAVERRVAESGYAVLGLNFQRDEVAPGAGDDHARGSDLKHERAVSDTAGKRQAPIRTSSSRG